MKDIEFIMDVLNKHEIRNISLANDIQLLAKESYLEGRFDEAQWWEALDADGEWIGQFELDEKESAMNDYGEYSDMINNAESVSLSAEDWKKFEESLDNPSPPSQELIDAFNKFKSKGEDDGKE